MEGLSELPQGTAGGLVFILIPMQKSHPVIVNEFTDSLLGPENIVFIVNPKAGTNLQRNIVSLLDKHLNHRKYTWSLWMTEGPGHGFELASKAVSEGYSAVVAVGGDGSVNEIAPALMGTPVALGIIPAGSGNGLAMHLGYGRHLEKAVKLLNRSEKVLIDVGMVNNRPFFNMAGVGFDGLVSSMMRNSNSRGFWPYFFKSVKAGLTFRPFDALISVNGVSISRKCFSIAVANGPMYGYNFTIAPDARTDDGKLEVVILKDVPRWQYFAAVPSTLNGKIYKAGFIEHYSAGQLTIHSENALYAHVDGEGFMAETSLVFSVKPGALNVLAPRPANG